MAEGVASEHLRDSGDELASGALQRGTRLGRYELVLPVAVGGMARVWAARLVGQRGFTKLVAIKTILPHLARDPEFERMFLDEARIASLVHHPNVCEIYELGEERGVLYLAMEWVNGDSLAHVLRVGGKTTPLDPRIAARIVADACAGLHAAHNLEGDDGRSLDVVHRDVAPHNILVSSDGNVKVADFGVAKALGQIHTPTSAGQLKGRIAYMAPEQATGGAVDRRSDLFSLGCVLYEATTGKQPFRGEGDHQVMHELLKGQLAPPSRVVKGYPYELERIVMRALERQPLSRFPTMERMRHALEEWLAKSGPVVTQSHVAAVVRERVGAEIDKRKERIKVASAAVAEKDLGDATSVTPTGPAAGSNSGVVPAGPPRPSLASIAPDAPRPSVPDAGPLPAVPLATQARPSPVQYALAAAIGIVAAAVMGTAAFFVWRALDASAPPPVRTAVAAPRAAIAPPIATIATGDRAASSAASASGAPIAAPPIAFRVVPEQAQLVVDGAPLAATVRTMERPAHGTTVSVVVHADGFEDEALKIDDSAPASVDVWLTPKKKAPSRGEGSVGGATKPEALPANPY